MWSSSFVCAPGAKDISIPDRAGPLSLASSLHAWISTSTPAKRKKVQNANILMSLVKVMKVEDDNKGWNQMVPQQTSCSDQPGTGCLVSPITLHKEDSLLEDTPDGNGGLHNSGKRCLEQ